MSEDVWFRTGKWASRKFPAEFPADAPVRHNGLSTKPSDVPIGGSFEVWDSEWHEAVRVSPPKRLHFQVEIEVEGEETVEDACEYVRSQLDSKHIRDVISVKSST